MSSMLLGICLITGGLVYCALGVCFSICYDEFLPPSEYWENSQGITFLFWPFFLLAMIVVCVFGCINKLYRWLHL